MQKLLLWGKNDRKAMLATTYSKDLFHLVYFLLNLFYIKTIYTS